AICRLSCRSCVKHIPGLIYGETLGVLEIFLGNAIRIPRLCQVTYIEHAKRQAPPSASFITALDVVYALKRSGFTLYGFELSVHGQSIMYHHSPRIVTWIYLSI
ncbi:uncharacterized protein EDB93DRAFT_1087848, partial [Suillus bovinus]|uniref:uncharacterized protein n=1 Tax=Suillus bovinus TaxID=48563 RepID=UPI001B86BBF6